MPEPALATAANRLTARTRHPTPYQLAAACTNNLEHNPPHLQLLDEYLLQVEAGNIDRLLVTMPPRHGKSQRISKWLPAWWLARHPSDRIIHASYGADFGAQWGRAVRDIIREHPNLGISLAADSTAANRWNLAGSEGGMVTVGVGGPMTGRGANLLLIDDPIKSREEAQSAVYREKTWTWYTATASTRLEPGGACIVVATRWHEDDLMGRLLANEGHRWTHLNLPAVAEDSDPLGRGPGDALWPERYDEEALGGIRHTLGSYDWAALYQQRPAPLEGGLFKRASFRYWHRQQDGDGWDCEGVIVNPQSCTRFATIDLAGTVKTSADWTVVSVWAISPQGWLLLLDVERCRIEESGHWPIVNRMRSKHRLSWVGVESRMFGTTLVYEAGRAGLPLRELKPDADKVTRALPAQARLEAGTVFWPGEAVWLPDWEHEVLSFPNGTHDDQVDTLAYACREIALGRARAPRPVKAPPEDLAGRVREQLEHRRTQARKARSVPYGM